jgi:voltage-gated potassium channel
MGLAALVLVIAAGTAGFALLGMGALDALYATITTITTVGSSIKLPSGNATKFLIIGLLLVGVGTAFYTFSAALEVLVEGQMRELVRRRRMDRTIAAMSGHVIICGWGRVGREVGRYLTRSGRATVIVDRNAERLQGLSQPYVCGDVTDDETLLSAGIERAGTLVAALDTDADNLFVTVASRSMRPDLQIIARARNESSEPKLRRAGADRVVNPQQLGGDRMAAFVTRPHVVDFFDVVLHEGTFEFRLEELVVPETSVLSGETLRSSRLHARTGALVLALRRPDGTFITNPAPEVRIDAGDVLIGAGTPTQLDELAQLVG